jgi:4-amino-4-deoxy-L-arabinose transferase-like glycosyltransferase
MSVGTGIVIGLIFLGLIWLYVSTWQRWRWKRIILWCFGILIVPILGFFGWLWTTSYMESRPYVEEQMWI